MLLRTVLACLVVGAVAGCASGSYQYGHGWRSGGRSRSGPDSGESVLVEVGQPRPIIDGVGWVLGIPGKLLLWDRRVDNHRVSPETQAALVQYLEQNELQDVCVRVNQYAPLKEWQRLRENRHVSPGWRYTAGLLSLAGYTILPGRLFGGDRYNPYTNSVYVYSDIPALAMVGGGYAKDIHSREYPGTYAVVNEFPVVSMWHETIATNDVLTYLQQQEDLVGLQAGYKILHPYYGAQAGGAARNLVGVGPLFQVGGAVVGHITGRVEGRRLERDQALMESTETQQASRKVQKLETGTVPLPGETAESEPPVITTGGESADDGRGKPE